MQVLDAARGGTLLGRLDTGAGLDNIDYTPSTGLVYAAAGKAARLVGAKNAVADGNGNAYVANSQGAHLLVLRALASLNVVQSTHPKRQSS